MEAGRKDGAHREDGGRTGGGRQAVRSEADMEDEGRQRV